MIERECKYKKIGKRLKEQFINGIIGQTITADIIRDLTGLKDISEVLNQQVLAWASTIGTQWLLKAILEDLKKKQNFM